MVEVNFACKKMTIEQIMKCSFNLSSGEMKVLRVVSNVCNSRMTVKDITKQISKDRTTVQRAVKGLFEKGLIKRRQINLDGGGYIFTYFCQSKKEIKELMKHSLKKFEETIGKEIDRW